MDKEQKQSILDDLEAAQDCADRNEMSTSVSWLVETIKALLVIVDDQQETITALRDEVNFLLASQAGLLK